MPSYRDKYGVDPPAQGVAGLTSRERNHIRSKLGISNDSNLLIFQETDERMLAFSQEQTDEARALYKSLDRIGDKTSRLEGGSKGIYASKAEDRAAIRRELLNLIIPSEEIRLAEQIPTQEEDDSEEFVSVPLRFSNYNPNVDEYSIEDS